MRCWEDHTQVWRQRDHLKTGRVGEFLIVCFEFASFEVRGFSSLVGLTLYSVCLGMKVVLNAAQTTGMCKSSPKVLEVLAMHFTTEEKREPCPVHLNIYWHFDCSWPVGTGPGTQQRLEIAAKGCFGGCEGGESWSRTRAGRQFCQSTSRICPCRALDVLVLHQFLSALRPGSRRLGGFPSPGPRNHSQSIGPPWGDPITAW